MSYELIPGKTRALCCECGTVRTCAAGYHGRNSSGPGANSQEHVDKLRAKGLRGFGPEPFHRSLGDMKCAGACGTITRHALLCDHSKDEARNHHELADYGRLPSPYYNRVWRLPADVRDELR